MPTKRTYVERGIRYGDGKVLDVYRPRDQEGLPVVLLWHGSGPDERGVLGLLASTISGEGLVVVVPDWQSDDVTAGRAHLSASISFSFERTGRFGGDSDRLILCGWSLGANAALDVTLHPDLVGGWCPQALVGIAGGYDHSPFSGSWSTDRRPSVRHVPTLLFHGTEDTVVLVERSRSMAEMLNSANWPVRLAELPTDHAGVIGTEYDPYLRRCITTEDPAALKAVGHIAKEIADLGVQLGPSPSSSEQ